MDTQTNMHTHTQTHTQTNLHSLAAKLTLLFKQSEQVNGVLTQL